MLRITLGQVKRSEYGDLDNRFFVAGHDGFVGDIELIEVFSEHESSL